MAPPITWRNVDGPDLTSAARILGQAQQSINGAFDAFGRPIQQAEALVDKNWQAMSNYNTDQFLGRLQQFKTPEELAAAQATGELQRMRDAFGAQINMTQARDATAALPQKLQQAFTQNQAYQDTKTEVGERPVVGQASQLIANKDFKGAREYVASQSGLRDTVKAKLLGDVLAAERAQTVFENGQEDQMFQRNADKRAGQLLAGQLNSMSAAAEASRASTEAARKAALPTMKDAEAILELANRGPNAIIASTAFNGEAWNSEKGRQALTGLVKETGTSAWKLGENPTNFVDKMVNKLVQEGVVTEDKKYLKVGKGTAVYEVPLTAEILRNAIAQDAGFFDPTVNSAAAFVKNSAAGTGMFDQAVAYTNAKKKINDNIAATQEELKKGFTPSAGRRR